MVHGHKLGKIQQYLITTNFSFYLLDVTSLHLHSIKSDEGNENEDN